MGNRVHRWLAVFVALIALGAFLGWRSLGSGQPRPGVVMAPIPSAQLNQLIAYARPLPNSVAIAPRVADTIALARDPFAPVGPSTTSSAARAPFVARVPTATPGVSQWDVTATLIAGARRAAVINDVLIYVGEGVPLGVGGPGARLTAVERDHVVITDSKGTSHTVAVKERDG